LDCALSNTEYGFHRCGDKREASPTALAVSAERRKRNVAGGHWHNLALQTADCGRRNAAMRRRSPFAGAAPELRLARRLVDGADGFIAWRVSSSGPTDFFSRAVLRADIATRIGRRLIHYRRSPLPIGETRRPEQWTES